MDAYATLDDLTARLDWDLDPDEKRIAASALEDASELAREYGRDWDTVTAPRLVRTLVLRASQRYMTNPAGYTTSRAGDETVTWSDAAGRDAGTVYFTDVEIRLLRGLAGRAQGVYSVPISVWGPQRAAPVQPVPVAGYPGEKPFPYFADESEPW